MEIREIKNLIFYHKLRTLNFVRAIYLFGSRAKNNAKSKSDIDIAVYCPDANDEEWQRVLEIIEMADTLLHIDCVRLDKLNDLRLKQEIEESKITLFIRVDNDYPWYDIFLDLGEAIEKFVDIMQRDENSFPYIIEAAIQIFEYNFELFWKLLKKICAHEGVESNSPRSAITQAYIAGLIKEQSVWLKMLEARNLTVHTYNITNARDIFGNCGVFSATMAKEYRNLKERYGL